MLAERPFAVRPIALGSLDDAVLTALYDYWRSRAAGRRFPLRAEILPEDMATHLHRLALLEVAFEPPFFSFRLIGGTAQLVLGNHMTGKPLDAVQPKAQASALVELCQAVVVEEAPQCRELTLKPRGLRRFTYRALALPLSSDGERIDRVLLAANWDADQSPLLQDVAV